MAIACLTQHNCSVCGCLLSNHDTSFSSVSVWEDHGEPLNSDGFVVLSCFCFISFRSQGGGLTTLSQCDVLGFTTWSWASTLWFHCSCSLTLEFPSVLHTGGHELTGSEMCDSRLNCDRRWGCFEVRIATWLAILWLGVNEQNLRRASWHIKHLLS